MSHQWNSSLSNSQYLEMQMLVHVNYVSSLIDLIRPSLAQLWMFVWCLARSHRLLCLRELRYRFRNVRSHRRWRTCLLAQYEFLVLVDSRKMALSGSSIWFVERNRGFQLIQAFEFLLHHIDGRELKMSSLTWECPQLWGRKENTWSYREGLDYISSHDISVIQAWKSRISECLWN